MLVRALHRDAGEVGEGYCERRESGSESTSRKRLGGTPELLGVEKRSVLSERIGQVHTVIATEIALDSSAADDSQQSRNRPSAAKTSSNFLQSYPPLIPE